MHKTTDTAIVIPAWNEAATIGRVVESVLPYGTVVVVDDASTDQTGDLAAQAGAVVVKHAENRGYDGALNSGFAKADELGVQYIVTFDADGQHDPENLPTVIDMLRSGSDLAVGIRPARARIAEKLFALVIWARYGLRDPLCGLKGYRATLYQEAGRFDSCQSIGTQLALHAARRQKKYRIKQFAVCIYDRKDEPRLGGSLKANWRISRALFRVLLEIR